ncbi:MAG: O-antigen ligase family protein [Proteobacteria bacterium]|nr:O-antigen ligase family protein [Pseudomonadota bacterium]MBS0554628.1 O-antigen ligase family protein [Pseudomonadota bacterium]
MTANAPLPSATTPARAWNHAATALVVLTVFGLPFGNLFFYSSALLALIGMGFVISHWRQIAADTRIRQFLLLFALFWVPMLFSLLGAPHPAISIAASTRYMLFAFTGIALIHLQAAGSNRQIIIGTAAVLAFWTADALMQFSLGFNIRGFPYQAGERLTGLFYPWPNIGYVMAVLSPAAFEGVRLWAGRQRLAWLALVPWFAVILLSSQRAALLTLALAIVAYPLHLHLAGRLPAVRRLLIPLLLVVTAVGLVASQADVVRSRLDSAAGMLSGDYDAANRASSMRLPLWTAAVKIYRDRWINGIGPRAYPEVVKGYLADDPDWAITRAGHPHFSALEIAAETGTIGLLGYAVALILLLRRFLSSRGDERLASGPWFLTALLASFPLASTISFYASMGSTLLWIPLACACAQLPRTRGVGTAGKLNHA